MNYIRAGLIEAMKRDEVDVIFHQVNAKIGPGAGFAKAINYNFREAYYAERKFRDPHMDKTKLLGEIFSAKVTKHRGFGYVVYLYSQYYPGACTIREIPGLGVSDNYDTRIKYLVQCLEKAVALHGDKIIGIPLVASGLGVDKSKIGKRSQLDYFKDFIAPHIEHIWDFNVYYL